MGREVDDRVHFERAWNTGTQDIRAYHDEEHFHDIAGRGQLQTEIDAIRFRAGINHDTVYQHVDAKGENKTGFAPGVEEAIAKYITRQGNAISLSKDAGLKDDVLFQAALLLFGFEEGKRGDGITLSPFAGQNEFLSALYAIEQARDLGIPARHILAEVAHIQGTVPFGPATHFDTLQTRLEMANGLLPADQRLTPAEIKDTVESAVRMANDDVLSFKKDFPKFVSNTRELMVENVAGSPENLDKPAFMLPACMGPVGFLEGVVAANSPSGKTRIFHSVHGKPGEQELARDEAKGIENIRAMSQYLRANAAAVALVTALTVLTAPEGTAPTADASLQAMLHRNFSLTARGQGELTDAGRIALAECKREILITDQVAGYLLETLGSEGVSKLAKLANDTGINPTPAMPPMSPNPKPGMNTRDLAQSFLDQAQAIFDERGVSFAAVRNDLVEAMRAPALSAITREGYAERVAQAKGNLQKVIQGFGKEQALGRIR